MSTNSHSQPINWSEITDQLQTGAYEAVAAYLWERQLASQQAGDAVTAAVIAAIRQLCLACHECRVKIAEHQQAIAENTQREAELYTHVQAMLAHMAGASSFDAATKVVAIVYPVVTRATTARVPVWRRLWRLLGDWWGQLMLLPDTLPPQSATVGSQVGAVLAAALDDTVAEAVSVPLPVSAVGDDELGQRGPLAESGEDDMVTKPKVMPAVEAVAEITATAPTKETSTGAPVIFEVAGVTEAAPPIVDAQEQTSASSTVPTSAPSLVVYCLGNFHVYQDDQLITEWPSNKGQLIFKYLLFQRQRPVAKEVLMDLFWPDAPPDAARNNLNVAIYGLRRALRRGRSDFSHVLFQNDCYLLNPDLAIWLDVEEFTRHLTTGRRLEQTGQTDLAIQAYSAAEALYQGEFLTEERYEDWPLPQRQQLQDEYLKLLDALSQYYLAQQDYELCAVMSNKLLTVDPCQEDAHRRLMHCYNQQGQHHLALRQYHRCVEALARELDVGPSQLTKELYAQIRRQ